MARRENAKMFAMRDNVKSFSSGVFLHEAYITVEMPDRGQSVGCQLNNARCLFPEFDDAVFPSNGRMRFGDFGDMILIALICDALEGGHQRHG